MKKTIVTIDGIEDAINSGYRASDILRDIISELADMHCPDADGLEGRDTFPPCGSCVVCLAQKIVGQYED